jgi:TM2 domain-containing membrane protein YozV/RNA polymerase subunit RPABC4/transcription elongation factor Spt4
VVICPDCGKEVIDAKFCSNCGSPLPKAEEVAAEEEVVDVPVVDDVAEEVAAEEEVVDVPVVDDVAEEDVIEEETPVEEDVVEEPAEDVKVNVKNSKFCTNCGTEVNAGTAFCPKCGFRFNQEEQSQTKFCQSCGEKININAEICPHCGVRVANISSSSDEKNVLLSAILSILFPGLGHLYLGLDKKGISFILAYIVSAVLILLLIGVVLAIIVWIWALIDSIKSTEAINRGEFVEDKLF